jgi:uncharacterized protein (TIGR03083 family)
VSTIDLQRTSAADGRDLLAAARTDWSRPIPHCPEWNAGQLLAHMGGILAWMSAIVTAGDRVAQADRERPPDDLNELPAWYSSHLDRTVRLLTGTEPDTEVWTFSGRGDRRVGWWRRRLAVEIAIHRWDVQHALSLDGGPAARPIDGGVAAAGIEEFMIEFLPGLLGRDAAAGLSGTLHLHATDGEGGPGDTASEWWIDLDARADAIAVAGHRRADTAVRGSRSDLLLWLTNREASPELQILGNRELGAQWKHLRR